MSQQPHPPQIKIPATYMRGGTSKGVFFKLDDLPEVAQQPGLARDRLLLRVIGSPDPYGKQVDGMGGATSSTSKVVIVCASELSDHDVDYLFGQVAIDQPFIDWSGNCGNLTAAVGAFAISNRLVDDSRIPRNGIAQVRIWQKNIGKTIIAHIPVRDGEVQECGDFELDGVTFPAAEIKLEFLHPIDSVEGLFPSGKLVDELMLPAELVADGRLRATFINAGIPTIFINARDLGYLGAELQEDINNDTQALQRLEAIRAYGAQYIGLIKDLSEIASRQHTPKLAMVAPPQSYKASSGKPVNHSDIDMCVRALSMGKLHHAMMGTAAVAIGVAAAIPGTLVAQAADNDQGSSVTFGHPSGSLTVGAEVSFSEGAWQVSKAMMSRSARVLMEGWIRVPF